MSKDLNLDWLNEFVNSLPVQEKREKNFIDIAGYPSWENSISNILQFYLENGEHGFGTLVLRCLLELLENKVSPDLKNQVLNSEYEVERERHRIDILIRERKSAKKGSHHKSKWAIIIENKIGAELDNPLQKYWDSVDATNKIGIVLSIEKVDEKLLEIYEGKKKHKFINILHLDLVNQIREKLNARKHLGSKRHRVLFEEYLTNLYTQSTDMKHDEKTEKLLIQFHKHRKEIKKVLETDNLLLAYVSDMVKEVMEPFGYKPTNSNPAKSRHYVVDEKIFKSNSNQRIPREFRFWIDLDRLKYGTQFLAHFELDGYDNSKYGTKVKTILKTSLTFTDQVKLGTGGNDKSEYQHIYTLKLTLPDINEFGFKDSLEHILKIHFFDHKSDYIVKAHTAYNKAKSVK